MGPFLVAIVAIIAWAVVQASQNWAKGASKSTPSAEQQELMQEVLHELEAAKADRKRLTQRVQNLEAIVTTETFDLAREDPEAAAARIDVPELDEEERPADRVERLARRVRP
jgi:hypothetical protein